jgi:tRNA (Thr-GGU) A37 N-methylase
MMHVMSPYHVNRIGKVVSSLSNLEAAPRQADEGAPEAWLVFEPEMLEGLRSLRAGDEVVVITWLDRATLVRVRCQGTPYSRP